MKNSDYVLRLESPLSGETNSYSSFIILHLMNFSLKIENVTPILHSSFYILHLMNRVIVWNIIITII